MSKDSIPRYITVSSEATKKNLDAQNIIGQLTYRQRYKGFHKFTRTARSLLRCIVEHHIVICVPSPIPIAYSTSQNLFFGAT